MYDWPEVRWATDALWTALVEKLRENGIDAPETLERERPFDEVWTNPKLIFSQTCGWPLITRLAGKVQLVATPVYSVAGCEGPNYSSFLVVRKDERANGAIAFRGRRIAFNSDDSFSGYVVVREYLRHAGVADADLSWIETGSHRASVRAVAQEKADLAGIDAVAWALAQRHEARAAAKLRVLATTPLRPALPFITARAHGRREAAQIRLALGEILNESAFATLREALFLGGTEILSDEHYAVLRTAARPTCQHMKRI